jgi:hypothetical protein
VSRRERRGAFGEPLAFETYQSALDREQRAAPTYAGLGLAYGIYAASAVLSLLFAG